MEAGQGKKKHRNRFSLVWRKGRSMRYNYARIGAAHFASASPKELMLQRQTQLVRSNPIPFKPVRDDGTLPGYFDELYAPVLKKTKKKGGSSTSDDRENSNPLAQPIESPLDLIDEDTLLPIAPSKDKRQQVGMFFSQCQFIFNISLYSFRTGS